MTGSKTEPKSKREGKGEDAANLRHLSHNFYMVRKAMEGSMRGKLDPRTGRPYSAMEVLDRASKIFNRLDPASVGDLLPVDTQEAHDLLEADYQQRYGVRRGKTRAAQDRRRRTRRVLVPGTPASSLYRLPGGPERFDMRGVDDAQAGRKRRSRKTRRKGGPPHVKTSKP